ncbi:MAG TPA: TonB-dependent copper receptor [Gammaproteobacteria bacterium]|nr:TonB-dependent copper receptor [Gammaproteobacteria bacterium]
MSKRGLITAAIASLSLPAVAGAQESLPEVPVEAEPLRVPAVTQGTPEAFSPAPAADGGELLRAVPGVWGSRFGGAGIDPTIRGQDETQLNVLLDGSYIHGGCPNRMDPPTAYVAPETYDEVEVIKGNQTVVYGGGGSGGTVLFKRNTERFGPEERLRGKVGGGYRSNSDTKEVFGDVATGNETGYARLIGNYADADNYEDGSGDEVRSAYTHTSGTALLGYTPDEHTRLELGLEAFRGEDVLYAGMMDAPETENDAVRLRFDRKAATGFLDGLKAEAYYNDVYHLMDNYSLRDSGMRMRVPSDSVTYGGRIQGDLFAGASTVWKVGVDYQFNNREANRFSDKMGNLAEVNWLQAIMWPDVDTAQTGVFSEVETELSTKDRVKVGLRYDRVTAEAKRADEATDGGMTPNDLYSQYNDGATADEVTEDNVGGLIHYARDLDRHLTFHGTLSRSVRTADASERFIASNRTKMMGDWVGNPAIDPEKHHQAEVGIQWQAEAAALSATAYYNDVTDYILRDLGNIDGNDNRANIYRNINATLIGGELTAQRKWAGHWLTRATASYVYGENDSDDTALAQTPPLEGTVGMDYQASRWNAGAEVRMAAKQTRVDLASGQDLQETPAFAVVNLKGGVELGEHAHLKLGVDNLLDTTYAEHINRVQDPNSGNPVLVNEPGRSVWARVKATF